MLFTVFASNIPDFKLFLERNPVALQILCAPDLRSVAKILADYAKATSSTPIKKEDEIWTFVKSIYQGESFIFQENVKKIAVFNTLFDPVSVALIQKHLFNLPLKEDGQVEKDHDAKVASLIADYGDAFREEQLSRLVKSPSILKGPIIFYNYADKKSPLTSDEADIFLQTVEDALRNRSGQTLGCLLFTGGHGSQDLLNNLSPSTLDAMIGLFRKYKVSVSTIAIDCCFGAWHLDKFNSILLTNGVIVANYMESNEHTILEAFNQSETTPLQAIESSLTHNRSIAVYIKSTQRVLALKPNEDVETCSKYIQAKRADYNKYLKSQKLTLDLTSVRMLLEGFKSIFASSTPISTEGTVSKARRQLLFPPAPELLESPRTPLVATLSLRTPIAPMLEPSLTCR